jgi:hypothetical protein
MAQHNERSRLVWVRGLRGPAPEKWTPDVTAGAIAGKIVLAERRLTEAESVLPLAELAERYPLPREYA